MLIVPAEHKFDARRLPYATLLLFLACLLVYGLYQSADEARSQAAFDIYVQQDLIRHELPLLESYLDAGDNGLVIDAQQWQPYFPVLLQPEFDAHVRDYWNDEGEPSVEWRAARERFESVRDRLSWVRFGLVPAEVKADALFGHMFLHGGGGHLVGNMIFLLLFGMLLERIMGSALFLATYLLTGLLAAGLFALVNSGSHVPLIGASGAISGLMGAWLGAYGLRKVRFFYTIGFWFGEFTAPALLVFPLWLAKELYGYFQGDGPVAYMAHAGGLLSGLLLALLLKRQTDGTLNSDAESRRVETDRREKLLRIRQLLGDLRIDEAVRQIEQAIRQTPAEPAYWEVYADAARRLPPGPGYQRVMTTLFLNAGNKALSLEFLRGLCKAYQERCPDRQPALAGKGGAALAQRFFHAGGMRDADNLLDAVYRAGGMSADFHELLHALLRFAERNSDRRRVERYRRYLSAAGAVAGEASSQAFAGPE